MNDAEIGKTIVQIREHLAEIVSDNRHQTEKLDALAAAVEKRIDQHHAVLFGDLKNPGLTTRVASVERWQDVRAKLETILITACTIVAIGGIAAAAVWVARAMAAR